METRETFFLRLKPFLSPGDLLDVELAYTLAKFSHRSQVRKETDENGDPIRYFEHVRRVAIVLMDEANVFDRDLIVSALLHDGMEDTRDLTPEMIEHCFGPDAVRIVKVLSKVPKDGYVHRFRACADWRPYAVKAADRLDNLRSLDGSPVEFRLKQVLETRSVYYSLFDRMVSIAPSEFHANCKYLRDEVMKATERRAVLDGA